MKWVWWVDSFLTWRFNREEIMEAKIKALKELHKSLLKKSLWLAYNTSQRVKKIQGKNA